MSAGRSDHPFDLLQVSILKEGWAVMWQLADGITIKTYYQEWRHPDDQGYWIHHRGSGHTTEGLTPPAGV